MTRSRILIKDVPTQAMMDKARYHDGGYFGWVNAPERFIIPTAKMWHLPTVVEDPEAFGFTDDDIMDLFASGFTDDKYKWMAQRGWIRYRDENGGMYFQSTDNPMWRWTCERFAKNLGFDHVHFVPG